MNLPSYRSLHAQPPGASAGHGHHWTADASGSRLMALIAGVMIVYLTVAPWLWTGQTDAAASVEGDAVSRLIKLALLGIASVIVVWRLRLAFVMLRWINPMFLAFLVIVPASALWSISRGDTIARFISIICIVQVCFAFTLVSWHRQRMQSVLRVVLTLLVLASIAVTLAMPAVTIEQGEGTLANAWRGVTTQKNQLGQLAGFCTILWLHAMLFGETRWWRALIFGAAAFFCLLKSRSSTSLLATVFSLGFLLLLVRTPQNLRRYMPYLVASFAILLVVFAMAVLKIVPGLDALLTPITSITGKDLTFSNRSEIWIIIKEHIQQSPWIGSGYGAYWTGTMRPSPSLVFLTRMYFYPFEAHNGYLEITNDLGFLGLGLLLAFLVFYVRQALRLMRIDRSQGALLLSLFFQQAVTNLSESTWLNVNSGFPFLIMTLATIALGRSLLEQQLRVYFGHPGAYPVPEAEPDGHAIITALRG